MSIFKIRNAALIMVLIGMLGSFDCEQRTTSPKEQEKKGPPSLEDGVPFDKLEFGKLVFHRYGPPENNYSCVYVVDVNAHRSWAISYSGKAAMVSPDGSKIAFSQLGTSGWWDIHVMNVDGSNKQDISNLEGQDQQPTWTPDSNEVLFWNSASEALYRQSPISNPPDRRVIRDFSKEGLISSPFFVSKNLKLIFFFTFFYPGGRKICTLDIDGTSFEAIGSEFPSGHECRSPCWSPDGQKIAYLLLSNQKTSLIVMVMDFDGKNARSLAELEMKPSIGWSSLPNDNDFSICWSPDGSKLIFNKIDGDYCYHLYLINVDGTGLSQVTFAKSVSDWSVSWSY